MVYPAYMPGHKVEEQMLHLRPLAESGRMMMFAFYPGGNLRMGLEDPLRTVGHTNTDMIKQAIALADEVGRPIATYQNALDVLSS